MINPKVQKVQRQIKEKLNGLFSLYQTKLKLPGYQRIIDQQRILRILTSIQVSHLLITIIDISKKSESLPLQQLKIGIIGCGVIGRMLTNDIIPLSKTGLRLQNVYISTRQTDNARIFQHFGVQVQFDNDRVVRNCNIIIVATPATLDNWILIEIGKVIKEKKDKKGNTNIHKDKPQLLFILTSGVNQKLLRSFFGEECLFILPYQNFQGVSELYDNQQLWETENENLNQFTLQQASFKLFEKNYQKLVQTLGNFFEMNSSSIGNASYPSIRQHLQSPCLIDNFLEKYKRLKGYVQTL